MEENTVETKSKKKLLVLAGLVAVSMAAVPAMASAQDDGSESSAAQQAVVVGDLEDLPDGVELDDLEEDHFEEPTAEELAAYQAIEEELAAVLDAAGIEYEWVDEDGFRWIEVDWEHEAAVDVVDEFYSEKYPLTAEEVAEINAETDELIEALEAAGVPVTVTTDDDGITEFEIESDDDAVLEAAEAVFADMFGDDVIVFEGCDDDELDDDE